MPVTLTHIAQVLHKYGAALDREAVTKVNIDFQHAPSDLGAVLSDSDWTLGVSIVGLGTGMAELFNQSWSYQGASEEEVLRGVYEEILASMKSFHTKQVAQAQALAETIEGLEPSLRDRFSVNGTHFHSPTPGG